MVQWCCQAGDVYQSTATIATVTAVFPWTESRRILRVATSALGLHSCQQRAMNLGFESAMWFFILILFKVLKLLKSACIQYMQYVDMLLIYCWYSVLLIILCKLFYWIRYFRAFAFWDTFIQQLFLDANEVYLERAAEGKGYHAVPAPAKAKPTGGLSFHW